MRVCQSCLSNVFNSSNREPQKFHRMWPRAMLHGDANSHIALSGRGWTPEVVVRSEVGRSHYLVADAEEILYLCLFFFLFLKCFFSHAAPRSDARVDGSSEGSLRHHKGDDEESSVEGKFFCAGVQVKWNLTGNVRDDLKFPSKADWIHTAPTHPTPSCKWKLNRIHLHRRKINVKLLHFSFSLTSFGGNLSMWNPPTCCQELYW